jgi:hypothetical protein
MVVNYSSQPTLITLVLTDSLRQQLDPLVHRQVLDRRAFLLVSVVPSMQEGETAFRLQAGGEYRAEP